MFAWLISHQPAVLFSHNKSATSNQPAVFFSQNKPATSQTNRLMSLDPSRFFKELQECQSVCFYFACMVLQHLGGTSFGTDTS
jgi:hypothetical protein